MRRRRGEVPIGWMTVGCLHLWNPFRRDGGVRDEWEGPALIYARLGECEGGWSGGSPPPQTPFFWRERECVCNVIMIDTLIILRGREQLICSHSSMLIYGGERRWVSFPLSRDTFIPSPLPHHLLHHHQPRLRRGGGEHLTFLSPPGCNNKADRNIRGVVLRGGARLLFFPPTLNGRLMVPFI
jgi:hypothetical protein